MKAGLMTANSLFPYLRCIGPPFGEGGLARVRFEADNGCARQGKAWHGREGRVSCAVEKNGKKNKIQ